MDGEVVETLPVGMSTTLDKAKVVVTAEVVVTDTISNSCVVLVVATIGGSVVVVNARVTTQISETVKSKGLPADCVQNSYGFGPPVLEPLRSD